MNLDGRRESSNVEDRRGMSGGKKAGVGAGILGVIIAMAIAYFSGGDPLSAGMQAFQENGGLGSLTGTNTEVSEDQREFTEEEQELARFSTQIMVLYTDGTQTACGQGSAQMGPFYCSGDQKLYIDLSFFTNMKKQLGADGDFAYAYVIAHEVGHHVEYLTGILQDAHAKMAKMNQTDANKLSVRLELLADFYAGVWAHHDNKMFGSLEDGDIEEARVLQPRHLKAAYEVVQARLRDWRRLAGQHLRMLRRRTVKHKNGFCSVFYPFIRKKMANLLRLGWLRR